MLLKMVPAVVVVVLQSPTVTLMTHNGCDAIWRPIGQSNCMMATSEWIHRLLFFVSQMNIMQITNL